MTNKIIQEDIKNILSEDLPWDRLKGKSVLVTGVSGLLPSYMTEVFLRAGASVVGVARNLDRAQKRFGKLSNLKLISADLSEPFEFSDKVDYIIHGASPASPSFYGTDPIGTLSPNVLGTDQLLRLAKKNNVKGFLYFSSSEVYGQVSDKQIPTKETDFGYLDPNQVRSCYGESKRMGETLCKAWNHQAGVPTFSVRPFHTYGPAMMLNDGRVFSDFVGNIVAGKDIVLKSEGLATRSYCYVADAAKGFFAVLLKGTPGDAYNIGNSQAEISVINLAETLVKLFPEEKLKVIKEFQVSNNQYLASPVQRSCPDTSKIQALGWKPQFDIKSGFKRTIESFKAGL